eukprot:Gb_14470 [translate_table: standard]
MAEESTRYSGIGGGLENIIEEFGERGCTWQYFGPRPRNYLLSKVNKYNGLVPQGEEKRVLCEVQGRALSAMQTDGAPRGRDSRLCKRCERDASRGFVVCTMPAYSSTVVVRVILLLPTCTVKGELFDQIVSFWQCCITRQDMGNASGIRKDSSVASQESSQGVLAGDSIARANVVEYGDVGVSSMIALMTEHEPHESESSIMTAVPSSFASFHAPAECLLSAAMFQAPQACQGDKLHRQSVAGHCVMEQLIMPEQAAISDSSLPSVKTEVCSHFGNQFEFHREQTGSCYAESSLMVGPLVTSLTSQPGDMVTSLEVTSPRFSKVNEADAIKAKIVGHPHYPSLVEAYMDCQKVMPLPTGVFTSSLQCCRCLKLWDVCTGFELASSQRKKYVAGCILSDSNQPRSIYLESRSRFLISGAFLWIQVGAPPEVLARLDALSEEYESRQHRSTISIGMDPELDQFMEAYCEMLIKYQVELTKPFKEAMAFLKKIETQLNTLGKGTIRISPSGKFLCCLKA